MKSNVKRFGLTQVSTSSNNHTVDIVFVHGLNGHPYHTWKSKEKGIFWPAELLPSALEKENARILVYGYDADIASFADGASKDKIHNHAEQLVAALCANRRTHKALEHPIIFVAHSLGGLIIKRALTHSSEISGHHTNHLRSVYISTYGIIFLGTPHMGVDVSQWGSQLENICGATLPNTSVGNQPYLINVLKTNNETLQNIDRQFAQLIHRFRIFYFHEGKPTNIEGVDRYVVNEESASPNTPDVERAVIQQTHTRMCQFESITAPGFDLVTEAIDRYATEAPGKIPLLWKCEKSDQYTRTRARVEELIPGTVGGVFQESGNLDDLAIDYKGSSALMSSHTDAAPESQLKRYYIVERQRVKDFVGRGAQLHQISSHFSSGSTQQPNVLILHALGGQGKSQIALEYCQRCRADYRGIFWVNASSEALALESYARIARVLEVTSATLTDKEDAVRRVRDFLECCREKWLLVFDNYDDPDSFKVQRLLPRSKYSLVKDPRCMLGEVSKHSDPKKT